MEDGAQPHRARIAAGLGRAGPDRLDGRGEIGLVDPDADEHAVGDAPRHAQRAGTASGDPDRHRPMVRQPRRPRRTDVDRLAVEQRPHEPGARLELLDAGRPQTGEPHGGVADTPAQEHATRRQLVDRGDRRRGDRGMPVHGVRQQRAERDALGGPRGGGQQHVGVATTQLGVRLQRGVPAERRHDA